jgi:hypothetical protein
MGSPSLFLFSSGMWLYCKPPRGQAILSSLLPPVILNLKCTNETGERYIH